MSELVINVRHADPDNDSEKYLLIWKDRRRKTEDGSRKKEDAVTS